MLVEGADMIVLGNECIHHSMTKQLASAYFHTLLLFFLLWLLRLFRLMLKNWSGFMFSFPFNNLKVWSKSPRNLRSSRLCSFSRVNISYYVNCLTPITSLVVLCCIKISFVQYGDHACTHACTQYGDHACTQYGDHACTQYSRCGIIYVL